MRLSDKDIEDIAGQLPEPPKNYEQQLPRSLSGQQPERLAAAATYAHRAVFSNSGMLFPILPGDDISSGFIARCDDLVLTSRAPQSGAFTFGVMVRTRRFDPETPQRLLGIIEYRHVELPIILSYGETQLHAPPINPVAPRLGSTACWIRSSPGNPSGWNAGALTARHVVETIDTGDPVAFSDASQPTHLLVGHLADKGACTIDAAVVALQPSDMPTGLHQLAIPGPHRVLLPPGTPVEVHGAVSGTWSARILRHFALPNFWGAMIGQRLFLDVAGQEGDSGALVQVAHSGEGLGIYMGSIPDALGEHEAVCQDLYQARTYLEFEAYI